MAAAVGVFASGDDYAKLCFELERQELEAPGGIASTQVYEQMLALLLLQNDLCNAKYLWKRIPPNVKTASPELAQVWTVGQRMWQRDFPGIYTALEAEWSEPIRPVMTALVDTTRARAIRLLSQAYSSISMDEFMQFVGMPAEQAMPYAVQQGWEVDNAARMVLPSKPDAPPSTIKPSEEQLSKLTEFVSFLEN